jgi:hypothetical protein
MVSPKTGPTGIVVVGAAVLVGEAVVGTTIVVGVEVVVGPAVVSDTPPAQPTRMRDRTRDNALRRISNLQGITPV